MYRKPRRPPTQGLLIRLGAFCGLVFGFSNGVLGQVDKAMNCSEDGICVPKQEAIGAADVLGPIGLGVLGGMALGLLLSMLLVHLGRTL